MHVNAQLKNAQGSLTVCVSSVTLHSVARPETADCDVPIGNAKLSSLTASFLIFGTRHEGVQDT
jgi:hypothetical protein